MEHLVFTVPVRRTKQNDFFGNGNRSSLYGTMCPITTTCKFANDRGIDESEVNLIGTKATLLGFE